MSREDAVAPHLDVRLLAPARRLLDYREGAHGAGPLGGRRRLEQIA